VKQYEYQARMSGSAGSCKCIANKQNPIDFIEAGDIGAAVGFKEIKTGDTLMR
jgi:translation elongation factor EF-G